MLKGLCAALLTCALAGACTVRETRTVVVPAGADTVCQGYGFTPGTTGYDNCVAREADARRRGRMAADYTESALVSDSQAACYSYGLTPGTTPYDRCVSYEINARRYR
ncbi:hypothetical protein [Vineibacter terrae]|uniref:hypothetical protein n=1 Tax=Vineibacter terrae TaxID=2586908 RepID=UPI002E3567E6|nr:hypothetical protein [Vineibacter terrae]HEX2890609.1 hypothetical protein [Vineibacter terrae]